jgi:putative acetyltransferase
MSKTEISIGPEDPRQAEVRRIIAESGAYLQALYPSESDHLADVDALAAPDFSGRSHFVSSRPDMPK